MARPSKLSPEKWAEVIRLHAGGVSAAELSRKYKVHPSQITRRVSQPAKSIKTIATMVAEAEVALESLPVSQQGIARTLADQLKGISNHAAAAALSGMKTAEILHGRALKAVEALSQDSEAEDYRKPAAILEVAGKAAALGAALMARDKSAGDAGKTKLEDLVVGGN